MIIEISNVYNTQSTNKTLPELQKLAEKAKIPAVRLPLDPEFSDQARLEGRIQSFLETLSSH